MWRRTIDPSSPPVNLAMAQQNTSFKTVLSDPHFNLSAHTFAQYTLPFDKISSILDFLTSDKAATHDLLALDQINQSIVALERRLDEHHWLAALKISSLLRHPVAQQLPQRIHDNQQPDCGQCRLPFVSHPPNLTLLLPLLCLPIPPQPGIGTAKCLLTLGPLIQFLPLSLLFLFLFHH